MDAVDKVSQLGVSIGPKSDVQSAMLNIHWSYVLAYNKIGSPLHISSTWNTHARTQDCHSSPGGRFEVEQLDLVGSWVGGVSQECLGWSSGGGGYMRRQVSRLMDNSIGAPSWPEATWPVDSFLICSFTILSVQSTSSIPKDGWNTALHSSAWRKPSDTIHNLAQGQMIMLGRRAAYL